MTLLAVALVGGSPAAHAQSHAPSQQLVEDLTQLARAALTMARLEDGSPVPPETPEEQAQPIISRVVEVQVIRRGELSAQMERCGLDWRKDSFLPFMQALRAGGWSGKKMAYVGMLHGMSQGMTSRGLGESSDGCAESDVKAMKQEAASLITPERGSSDASSSL